MVASNPNDREMPADRRVVAPDADGHAGLLLAESLIHGLIAKRVLSVEDAIAIVAVATGVTQAIADDIDEPTAAMAASLAILEAMRASLRIDHDRPGHGAPRDPART